MMENRSLESSASEMKGEKFTYWSLTASEVAMKDFMNLYSVFVSLMRSFKNRASHLVV